MKRYIRTAIIDMKDEPAETRREIAASPHTREDELLKLAMDGDPYVVAGLLRNPNLPVSILEILTDSRLANIRYAIAGRETTPPDILEKLSRDEDWEVRVAVAGNPNTPEDILNILSQEGSTAMIYSLLMNPRVPSSLVARVAGWKWCQYDPDICDAIINCPNTPADVRERLEAME